MKNSNGKIKAFTLQEMIVVLLITSIVVGMAFSVLNLVQRQMGTIKGIYEVKLEANQLRQLLWVDFNRYSYITYDAKKEQLNLSNELETKYYELSNNRFVSGKDTFQIQMESKQFYFNNALRSSGEIDAIELRTDKESGGQYIFVYKKNAPNTYLNQ